MAFKIKSAKIFFWNKRTHSDVVVGSTLILAEAATGKSTGRENEASSFLHPASEDILLAKVRAWEGQLSVTRRRRGSERERQRDSAAGETEVSLVVRLQSKLPCKLVP